MSFSAWSLGETLPQKPPLEAHFSRGFLRCKPERWFSNLGSQWAAFFQSLSASPKFVSATPRLDWPEHLARETSIEVDGEGAVIGLDDHTLDFLIALISPGLPAVPAEVFFEYIERRFCSTVRAAWIEEEPMVLQYVSGRDAIEIEVASAIQLRLAAGDAAFDVWLGCGQKLTERLDYLARNDLQRDHPQDLGDQVRTISVELAELWVPPALLIDYMRAGTVIDLERPSMPTARLLLDGQPWAEGQLCMCNETLAVEITNFDAPRNEPVEGSTHLSIILCSTQLDLTSVREHEQKGAILSLGVWPPSTADIVIGSETVATAEVGEVDGQLAVQVQTMA